MTHGDRARALVPWHIATAVGLVGFWIAFFTVGLDPADPPPGYFAFEHAFPLPDGLLAVGLAVAGWMLANDDPARRARGRAVSLVCAGGLYFLGVIDFSFNIQNGMYTRAVVDGAFEAALQVWCLGYGTVIFKRCVSG